MDFDPTFTEVGSGLQGELHFEQLFGRAVNALDAASAIWDYANEPRNMVRQVSATEEEFRNDAFQEDLSYKNQLISIFGKPYEGTIGPGQFYPAGYDGLISLFICMLIKTLSTNDTVPLPTKSYAEFSGNGIKDKLDDTKDFNAIIASEMHGRRFCEITKLTADAATFWSFGIDLSERHNDQSSNAPQGMLEKFAPTFWHQR